MSDLLPSPDETLDRLAGPWRVFQLARGHRFSTDDQVTAWRASHVRPQAMRMLDMGCGIGSVGLSTLYTLDPAATMVGIEAQDISIALLHRSLRLNGLDERVEVHHGDLRDSAALIGNSTFELITGSPPYMPVGKGLISPHPQRAACRVELRGSVFDYCEAARRHLAPGGRFVFVMLADDPRTEAAPLAHGLAVTERYDYAFREGHKPLIATLVCAREEEGPFERRVGLVTVRDKDGEWTPEYLAIRDELKPEGSM